MSSLSSTPRAFAIFWATLIDGFRNPLSISPTWVGCIAANSASFSCEIFFSSRFSRTSRENSGDMSLVDIKQSWLIPKGTTTDNSLCETHGLVGLHGPRGVAAGCCCRTGKSEEPIPPMLGPALKMKDPEHPTKHSGSHPTIQPAHPGWVHETDRRRENSGSHWIGDTVVPCLCRFPGCPELVFWMGPFMLTM